MTDEKKESTTKLDKAYKTFTDIECLKLAKLDETLKKLEEVIILETNVYCIVSLLKTHDRLVFDRNEILCEGEAIYEDPKVITELKKKYNERMNF